MIHDMAVSFHHGTRAIHKVESHSKVGFPPDAAACHNCRFDHFASPLPLPLPQSTPTYLLRLSFFCKPIVVVMLPRVALGLLESQI